MQMERQNQLLKLLQELSENAVIQSEMLLIHRNTLSEGMLTSPALKLMGRRTGSNLPITKDLLKPVETKLEKTAMERKNRKHIIIWSENKVIE